MEPKFAAGLEDAAEEPTLAVRVEPFTQLRWRQDVQKLSCGIEGSLEGCASRGTFNKQTNKPS